MGPAGRGAGRAVNEPVDGLLVAESRAPVGLEALASEAPGSAEAPAALAVHVVATEAALDGLEAEWIELSQATAATVFQTWEWVRPWWRHFGRGRRLHCLLFRDGALLVGIAPLFREPVRVAGITVARRLRFLGGYHSDYLEVIVRPGYEVAVFAALGAHLGATAGDWDVLDVEAVADTSPMLSLLPPVFERHGLAVHRHPAAVCPWLSLPGSWPEFLQALGPKNRANFRQHLKKLSELYRVEIEVYRDEGDHLERAVAEFKRIHEKRWRSLGYPAAVRDAAFHLDYARRFARRRWLRFYFLKVDGLRVAVCLIFSYRGTMYYYLSHAHGPKEVMKYSPGFLLTCLTARDGIEEGMKVYDLLRGDEAFKYQQFRAVDAANWFIRVPSPSPAARLRFRLFTARELFGKAVARVRGEYYDFRRFQRTKDPSLAATGQFLRARGAQLAGLAAAYLRRNFG